MSADELFEESLSESHSSVVAIRNGDVAALGRLAEHLRPYLKHVVRNSLAGQYGVIREEESDMVQRTLVRAVESVDAFRGQSMNEWRLWLAAIARNQVRDSMRFWSAQRRTYSKEIEWDEADERLSSREDSPSSIAESTELQLRLEDAVNQLSSEQQQLIQWRNKVGLSHAEIAQRLNISTETARQRAKAAMDELRKIWRSKQ